MGLFSKLKGKSSKEGLHDGYNNNNNNNNTSQGGSSSSSSQPPAYAAPSGAPPSSEKENNATGGTQRFMPPPGEPPAFDSPNVGQPSNPVPSYGGPSSSSQQTQHYQVPNEAPPPDYGALPSYDPPPGPPPVTSHWTSPTTNATYDAAKAGHDFIRNNPFMPPYFMAPQYVDAVRHGDISLQQSPQFRGQITRLSQTVTKVQTAPRAQDCTLLSTLPLYAVLTDQPREKDKKTIYYEIKILSLGPSGSETSVAIGFSTIPYPTWRLPGFHRGSIGVHSDDGHRFINDSYGGRDFTSPFRVGDTIGLGMRFRMQRSEVFLTRNGVESGSWWIDEEVDAEEVQFGGIDGLQGECDLYAAVGVYDQSEILVDFGPKEWRDS